MNDRIFPYTPQEAKDGGFSYKLNQVNKEPPFPTRLRELRKEHKVGPTQQYLADEIGITKPSVTGYESGKNVPDLKIATRLAAFYGVSVDYLCCQSEARRVDVDYIAALKAENKRLREKLTVYEKAEAAIMALADKLKGADS